MKTNITKRFLKEIAKEIFEYVDRRNYVITNDDYYERGRANRHIIGRIGEDALRQMQVEAKKRLSGMREEKDYPSFSPKCIQSTAQLALREQVGQCYETSCIVFTEIAERYFGHDLTVEQFNSPWQDHNYVVVNRKQNSDPLDPSTWGDLCIIIDRWAYEYGFAHEHVSGRKPLLALSFGDEKYLLCVSEDYKYPCKIPKIVSRQLIDLRHYKTQEEVKQFFESEAPSINAHIMDFAPRDLHNEIIKPDKQEYRKLAKKMIREKYLKSIDGYGPEIDLKEFKKTHQDKIKRYMDRESTKKRISKLANKMKKEGHGEVYHQKNPKDHGPRKALPAIPRFARDHSFFPARRERELPEKMDDEEKLDHHETTKRHASQFSMRSNSL